MNDTAVAEPIAIAGAELLLLPAEQLHEHPKNPRQYFAEGPLAELEASIRQAGIRTPLIVWPRLEGGGYWIAAGARRFRAGKRAGLSAFPCLVREMSEADFLEVLTFENAQREDVHPLEEAASFRAYMEEALADVPDVAGKAGKSTSHVYARLKLLDSIDDAQRACWDGHGDCRAILPALQPVDAIVTDPPYGETGLEWDRHVRGWMDAAEAVTRCVWCFGSLRFFMELTRTGECARWSHAQEIVWEKHNGSSFHADRFKRVHELAVQFYRGEWSELFKSPVTTPDATARTVRRKQGPPHTGHIEAGSYTSFDGGPRLMRTVIYARSCHGGAEHPTQKPTAIIAPLLQYSVPPGGAVADCFMGSGSTLVAAKLAGCQAVGIDIDEQCCEIAARRLSQGVLELVSRDGWPTCKQ